MTQIEAGEFRVAIALVCLVRRSCEQIISWDGCLKKGVCLSFLLFIFVGVFNRLDFMLKPFGFYWMLFGFVLKFLGSLLDRCRMCLDLFVF